jgi:hypothetical protein
MIDRIRFLFQLSVLLAAAGARRVADPGFQFPDHQATEMIEEGTVSVPILSPE